VSKFESPNAVGGPQEQRLKLQLISKKEISLGGPHSTQGVGVLAGDL
jgi:hypothetical protein